jgi:hypothetical protein
LLVAKASLEFSQCWMITVWKNVEWCQFLGLLILATSTVCWALLWISWDDLKISHNDCFNTVHAMKIGCRVIFVNILSICSCCIKTELLATLKMCVLAALTEVAANRHCTSPNSCTYNDSLTGKSYLGIYLWQKCDRSIWKMDWFSCLLILW